MAPLGTAELEPEPPQVSKLWEQTQFLNSAKIRFFRHVPCRVLNHSRKLPLGLSENGGFKNTNVWWIPPPGRAVSVPSPETGQQRNVLELGAGNSEDERTKQT